MNFDIFPMSKQKQGHSFIDMSLSSDFSRRNFLIKNDKEFINHHTIPNITILIVHPKCIIL